MSNQPVRVLFVCLGNICRSPTAHGVFEQMVRERGLHERIEIDSCGTGDWHIGHPADRRAAAAAARRGYDLSHLRARQVIPADFDAFDYVLAMDAQNLADLEAMRPAHFDGVLSLFLDFAQQVAEREVPDPYYGGEDGFDHVLDLVENASAGLLREILGADTAR
ncbi:low molecular weight protein-tyrosine-phosphatase [Haliea sp. E17]|uniref:low molecular weight protein-tyrosine-phosphatase n=1 Tax=Haliea sp. E17 TaxID=3401576 RepID=UPI003AB021E8